MKITSSCALLILISKAHMSKAHPFVLY